MKPWRPAGNPEGAPPPPSLVAAAGKAGAIVGAYGFVYASHSTDSKKTDDGDRIKKYLNILGVISFLGMCKATMAHVILMTSTQNSCYEASNESCAFSKAEDEINQIHMLIKFSMLETTMIFDPVILNQGARLLRD
ncbi:hypothetical protein Ccrd_018911 [Cynara cardunculus var. scolymus]|uniref:Uncharacterized protein n=1 Tax=Cynara cardunculus var. scolymus TaxID=59895 RepID=A0A103Y5C9_CYNCS|nr:hypothetical protein Ccrd_018911 [Cynara cardunculus var. scolymus]